MSYVPFAQGPHHGMSRADLGEMLNVAKTAILQALDSGDPVPAIGDRLWMFLQGGKEIERIVIEAALIEVLAARGRR